MSDPTDAAVADLAVLYEDHVDAIHAYVARRLGRELASEVTAETFRLALDRVDQFDPDRGSPRMWLFGIATNLIRRHWRTEQRRLRAMARAANSEDREDPAIDPGLERVVEQLDADAELRAVLEAVADLEENDRALLVLLAWEECSHEEIARVLDIPTGTVRSRLHWIRRELRSAMSSAAAERPSQLQEEGTTHG